MNIYSATSVKAAVKVSRYFEDQGVPLKCGRTRAVATWRGGTHNSVAIDDEKGAWFDHVAGTGGSVIDAFITIEGGTPLQAIQTLGERYHVEPIKQSRKPKKITRGEMLILDGYKLTNTYTYTDEHGEAVFYVDRYEKPIDQLREGENRKEFVQRSLDVENLDGVHRVLYNLPAVVKSQTVYLVEGEKDVETMRRLNLVATTNSGGAKYWQDDFDEVFTGKDVVIIADNDESGERGANIRYQHIVKVAKSCRVCKVSALPKGDVTDFIEKEGGTLATLLEKLTAAKAPESKESVAVSIAKEANKTPLANYTWGEIIKKKNRDGSEKAKQIPEPRRLDDICNDIHDRFLGFPKRLGSELFDYTRNDDPNKRKIMTIDSKDALKAWVNATSGQQSDFMSGGRFSNWAEVYERLHQTSSQYDGIAKAPWYPQRDDVFPIYEILPPADPTHSKFDEFVAFFNPATAADKTLLRAFFMAPMFYNGVSDRPAWCIDTVDAQQSGKSTVVKMCARLYNEAVLDMDLRAINGELATLKKRILSSEGRAKRIALFDNLETALKGGNLAQLITASTITGLRPYGRGEETRQNDITWTATVNGAEVDTDMSTRTYTIHIKAPPRYIPRWEEKVCEFVETNRSQLHADIIDMLSHAKERVRDKSRFATFDAMVLSAAAYTDDEFAAACAKITEAAENANEDVDRAAEIARLIDDMLTRYSPEQTGIQDGYPVILLSNDLDEIVRKSYGATRNWTAKRIRRLIKTGKAPQFSRTFDRLQGGEMRRKFGLARAFCYFPSEDMKREGFPYAQLVTIVDGVPHCAVLEQIQL